MPPASPHRAALLSLPALESLKRDQLIKLAKRFDLKANGKNTDLISRLFEHGKTLFQSEADDQEGQAQWSAMRAGEPNPAPVAGPSEAPADPPSSPPAPRVERPPSPLRRTASPRHSLRDAYLGQQAPAANSNMAGAPPTPLPDHPAFRPITSVYPSLSPNSLAGSPSRPRPSIAASAWSAADSPGIRAVPTPRKSMPGGLFGVDDEDEEMEVESAPPVPAVPERAATPPPTAAVASPPPFVFGSPNAADATFTFGNALLSLTAKDFTTTLASASTAAPAPAMSAAELLRARIVAERLAAGGPADRPLVPITFTATLGKHASDTSKTLGKKEEQFAGAHKRAFEKMDSIADHYAARRSPNKGKRPAEDVPPERKAGPSGAKDGEARPGKRSKMVSSASSKGSLAGALRKSGWASVPNAKEPKALSARAKGEAALARSSALLSETEAREAAIRKRQFELAKARRKSGAGGAGLASARKERRRSIQIGPPPKTGNAASRFLAGAFKKMVGKAPESAVPTVKKVAAPAEASTLTAVKPAPRLPSSKSTFALPTATSQAKARLGSTAPSQVGSVSSGPTKPAPSTARPIATGRPIAGSPVRKVSGPSAKPKFDLEASLARPLSYMPKVGPGAHPLVRTNSTLRMSTTTAGGSPNSTRRASTLSLAGRVGNVGLMKAVRPQGGPSLAEVDVLPDDEKTPVREVSAVGGAAMEREDEVLPRMSGSFPSFSLATAPNPNALSAAPEALLTAKSAFCFGAGSAASAALSLGSPIHTLASPRPVLGAHNFLPPSSPGLGVGAGGEGAKDLTELALKPVPSAGASAVKKKAPGTPGKAPVGRKMVSGASRGARDLKAKQAVGKAGEGLESRARKVAAAKAGGGKGLRVGAKV